MSNKHIRLASMRFIIIVLLALMNACGLVVGSEPAESLPTETEQVRRVIMAFKGERPDARPYVFLRAPVVVPTLESIEPVLLENLIKSRANAILIEDGTIEGSWADVFTGDGDGAAPAKTSSLSHSSPEGDMPTQDVRDEYLSCIDLVRKAKQELAALPVGDRRLRLYQQRVSVSEQKVALLQAAHPELMTAAEDTSVAQPEPNTRTPVDVDGVYPKVSEWEEDSGWMSVSFPLNGNIQLETLASRMEEEVDKQDDGVGTYSTSIVSVVAVKFDLKQVQIVRGAYSPTAISRAIAKHPEHNGKLIITDLLLARNTKARVTKGQLDQPDIFQRVLIDTNAILRVGPFHLAGHFAEELSSLRFTPSVEGDYWGNSSIQIIGYICERIAVQ